MMRALLLALALAGCTKAAPPAPAPVQPAVARPPAPAPPPAKAATVTLTAITLADDCGGTPPMGLPEASNAPAPKGKRDAAYDNTAANAKMKMKRRCEQTSMQLAIAAADAATIKVKSVELFDESGKSLGALTPSKPTKWSETSSTYEAWDEAIAKDSTSNVSYVLSRPDWTHIGDRYNKTFTVKTVITVGAVDAPAEKSITLSAPASLPPGVKT
ncbi:MAG TPA: hypothetical protein VGM90_19470 [Kofleriaceae bacterium]|jgi:hypothetical protein